MKWARPKLASRQSGPFPTTGDCATSDHGWQAYHFCSSGWCSVLEHDHKLFLRPLNAIINCGNDDPDRVGHLSGDGDRGSGPGSRGTRTGPDFIGSPNFKNLIIVNKRGHSANGLILRRSV